MNPQNIEAICRLTPLQEGLLFHELDASLPGVYFQQYSCILDGPLDEAAWRRAWEFVVQRHAALRTLFSWENRREPLQIVRRQVPLPYQLADWSRLPHDVQLERIKTLLSEDRRRGFDLNHAPLMRLQVARLASERHHFIWSFHHLSLDGWSSRLIRGEVLHAYQEFAAGRIPDLQPARPFADYVRWLQDHDSPSDVQFFGEALAEWVPSRWFPAVAGRVPAAEDRHQQTALALTPTSTERLQSFARQNRVTLSTVVVGAWATLLSRYHGTDDVVFGQTISTRPPELAGSDSMAGLMINTVPCRINVRNDVAMTDWLRELQQQQIAIQQHAHAPLASVQRRAGSLASPLFDSIVVVENLPHADAETTSSLTICDEHYHEYSNYALAFLVEPGDCLRLIAVSDWHQIDSALPSRILEQMQYLLEILPDQKQTPPASLPVLPPRHERLILSEWNNATIDAGPVDSVLDRFEQMAARFPDRPALASAEGKVSYAELDHRANRIAHQLLSLGVGRGSLVGVCHADSRDALVSFLAVMKSGAAYAPLDPLLPPKRLDMLLDDLAGAGDRPIVVLTDHMSQRLFREPQCRPLRFDGDHEPAGAGSGQHPATRPKRDDLVYVMFTSGSTGRPKGVMVTHQNLACSTGAREDFYPGPVSRFLLLSPLAADSSVAGIYWTLTSGGTLYLLNETERSDPFAISRLIEREGITHSLCLPSLYHNILNTASPDQLRSLAVMAVAGESCSRSVVETHYERLPKCALYNEYGPTEATVWSTACRLANSDDGPVSIGKPISTARIYVLDDQRRLVPPGVVGEIYIGGPGVAKGYWQRPELTDERFVCVPSLPDSRLYRTGDLARQLSDGSFLFLGRTDQQVKIRGYRIELAEVETALRQHQQLAEVHVTVVAHDRQRSNEGADSLFDLLGELSAHEQEEILAEIERLTDIEVRFGVR